MLYYLDFSEMQIVLTWLWFFLLVTQLFTFGEQLISISKFFLKLYEDKNVSIHFCLLWPYNIFHNNIQNSFTE